MCRNVEGKLRDATVTSTSSPVKQAWEDQISALEDQLQSMRKRCNHERERCAKLEAAYRERNAWLASRKPSAAGDGLASGGSSPRAAAAEAAGAPDLSVLPKTDETLVEVCCSPCGSHLARRCGAFGPPCQCVSCSKILVPPDVPGSTVRPTQKILERNWTGMNGISTASQHPTTWILTCAQNAQENCSAWGAFGHDCGACEGRSTTSGQPLHVVSALCRKYLDNEDNEDNHCC